MLRFLKSKPWCCKTEHLASKAKGKIDGTRAFHRRCLHPPPPTPTPPPSGNIWAEGGTCSPWEVWEWHSRKAASCQVGCLKECDRSLLCWPPHLSIPHECFSWPPPRSGNVLVFRQLLESPSALTWVTQIPKDLPPHHRNFSSISIGDFCGLSSG